MVPGDVTEPIAVEKVYGDKPTMEGAVPDGAPAASETAQSNVGGSGDSSSGNKMQDSAAPEA